MDTLDGLKTVIAVVESGSFTAASERLGLSKALVSKYIAEVEDKLDVRLFNRTTRRISLTEAGKNYYLQAQGLLEQYEYMLENISGEKAKAKGTLRISAPVAFGEQQLTPLLAKFMQQNPAIKIELFLSNHTVDMLEEGIDVRLKVGTVHDSTMVARKICDIPMVLCAATDYLEKHGRPLTPQALTEHNCIVDSNFSFGKSWPMYVGDSNLTQKKSEQFSKNQKIVTIAVNSNISANSPIATAKLAMAGVGIAMVPDLQILNELTKGRLEIVLPKTVAVDFALYAIYPHRRHVARKLKCFIDFIMTELGETQGF